MVRRGKYQARRGGNGSHLPGWAWLLIGAALALVVVILVPDFKSSNDEPGFFRPRPNPDARPAISALDEADPPRPRPAEDPERPLPAPLAEPDFDFYTVLPEQETALSDTELAARARAEARIAQDRERAELKARAEAAVARAREIEDARGANQPRPPAHPDAADPATPAVASAPAATGRYLLQAGAFSNPAEAESLKAQIALLGLQAKIEPGTVDGKPIHRVRLGPYASAAELTDIKQRLGNGGLSALAVRVE